MTSAAERLGSRYTFVGVDVGLPMAIQADQLPFALAGASVSRERPVDRCKNDNGGGGNSQSYPRFSAH
jgi:hypothetical protein